MQNPLSSSRALMLDMSTLQERVQQALDAGHRPSELARAAKTTAAAVSHWIKGRTKTLSAEAASGLAQLTGWQMDWWISGRPPRQVAHGPGQTPVDQSMSHLPTTMLPEVTKGALMTEQSQPEVFMLKAWDDALAPWIKAGDEVIWSTSKPPKLGASILVRDKLGEVYMRRMHEGLRQGHFIAKPRNDAYRSLDSATDGLEIIACYHGRIGDEELP